MAKEITLPELGEGVTEGELVQWLVKTGDVIEPDQAVAELMTDKATVEVPSPSGGKVVETKGSPGDVIEVGQILLVLDTASEQEKKVEKPVEVPPAAKPAAEPVQMTASMPTASGGNGSGRVDISPPPAGTKVLATPHTRRLAREMNVDINQLQGSGLAGRVTREDVLQAKSSSGAVVAGPAKIAPTIPKVAFRSDQTAREERVALRGIRKKIAENMQLAKQIVPHFTLMDEANVTELVKTRSQLKDQAESLGVKVTYLPFVIKALIATVREFPEFNASIDDAAQEIVYKKYFNVGFAADTPNGLLVPVIKDADQKTIIELSGEVLDLAGRARDGKLALDEMKGATITITNIGSVSGTYATPIINHPEVGILGMYKIQDKPVVKQGELIVEKFMNFTITCDHRLIDGAVAARFLKAFIQRVESPQRLMLDMV